MPTLVEYVELRKQAASQGPLVSDWVEIDQARIDTFGKATEDDDPLHTDPAYARAHSPFGTTISFGFLTMSLMTRLFRGTKRESGWGYELNYGFDRLRLPRPVPVGSRVRGVFRMKSAEIKGHDKVVVTYDVTVEVEGSDRPALVADWLGVWVNDGVERPLNDAG